MSNARRLASAFGTEQDKFNCSFYHKVGACRHGDRCSRQHAAPAISQTISVPNMYVNPFQVYELQGLAPPPEAVTEEALQKHLEDFFEDVHTELSTFGRVEDMHVCNNLGVHLNGRLYARFEDEDSARAAFNALQGRFYGGRMLSVEYSPVQNFREGRCKQSEDNNCQRGGNCNFMHVYKISDELEHDLFGDSRKYLYRRGPPNRRDHRHNPYPPRRDHYGGGHNDYGRPQHRERDDRSSRSRSPRRHSHHRQDRYGDRGDRYDRYDRYGDDSGRGRYSGGGGGYDRRGGYEERPSHGEGRYSGHHGDDRYGHQAGEDRYAHHGDERSRGRDEPLRDVQPRGGYEGQEPPRAQRYEGGPPPGPPPGHYPAHSDGPQGGPPPGPPPGADYPPPQHQQAPYREE